MTETASNQILFHVVVEDGGLLPAGGEEGLADETLDVGGDGTATAMVLVVALAREETDEVVLDGPLHVTRHVVIDGGKSDGHADGLVVAEQGTA